MDKKILELLITTKMNAANEIADQFTPGFFDGRMVSDVANIIGKHFEKFSVEVANEYISLIKIEGATHCFTNNDYGVGYTDGRNDAAYLIEHHSTITEDDKPTN